MTKTNTKVPARKANDALPVDTYLHLQAAFEYFNAALFDRKLPYAMLTINTTKRNVHGYAWQNRFKNVNTKEYVCEISLNPDSFERGLKEAMSTLVHEMVHHWEFTCSPETVSRGGYHNAVWAAKMESVGLMASNTSKPGGKKTGQSMGHYIIEDGMFEQAFDKMPGDIALDWHGIATFDRGATPPKPKGPEGKKGKGEDGAEVKSKNKVKFVCLKCGDAAWGKPTLKLLCASEEHDDVLDMVLAK